MLSLLNLMEQGYIMISQLLKMELQSQEGFIEFINFKLFIERIKKFFKRYEISGFRRNY